MMLGNIARNLQLVADYQRDCIGLASLLPYPYKQVEEAVRRVAYKWMAENVSSEDLRIQLNIDYPPECEEG